MSSVAVTWQVLQAVATRLAGATTAQGRRTNIGTAVLLEQQQGGPGPVERCSVYLDRATRTNTTFSGGLEWLLQIIVEVDVPSTRADAQARAHAGMADVFDLFPPGGAVLSIAAGLAEVEAQFGEMLTRLDGANSSIAQIRLQGLVRIPA